MRCNIQHKQYAFRDTLIRLNETLSNQRGSLQVFHSFDDIQDCQTGDTVSVKSIVMCVVWTVGGTNDRVVNTKMDMTMYDEICHILCENKQVVDIVPFCGRVMVLVDVPNKCDVDNFLITVSKLNALGDVVRKCFSTHEGAFVKIGLSAVYDVVHIFRPSSIDRLGKSFIWETAKYEDVSGNARKAKKDEIRVIIDENIYTNICQEYKKMFREYSEQRTEQEQCGKLYQGNVYNLEMRRYADQ